MSTNITFESEPNSQIAVADPIPTSAIMGQISTKDDLDYYQFKTLEPTVVKLNSNVSFEKGCHTHRIQVIDSKENIYAGTEIGLYGQKNTQVNFFLDQPNDYFIKVSSIGRCHNTGKYILSMSLDPTPIFSSCEQNIKEKTSCEGSKNYKELLSELNKQNKILQKNIADLTTTSDKLRSFEKIEKADETGLLQERLSEEEEARIVLMAVAEELRDRLKNADAELTAMTLMLETQRQKAEETLTLLAAADNARSAIDNRLKETLFALEVANSEIVQKKQLIEKLVPEEKQILAELDKSNLALAAALSQRENLKQELSETTKSLNSKLMIALGEKSEIKKNNTELRKNLENALVARLAADALAKSNLEEAKRKQLLLNQAERELESQASKNKKSKEELIKAERQTALLNQQLSEVRKQLGELDTLLSISEERDQEQKAQLKNVGSRLNQALASLASEERKRRKLEENERKRLEGQITTLEKKLEDAETSSTSKNSSTNTLEKNSIRSFSSDPLSNLTEEFDIAYCYLKIELYSQGIVSNSFDVYLEKVEEQFIVLTDSGTLKNQPTKTQAAFLKLLVKDKDAGSCAINDKNHIFPIIEKRNIGNHEVSGNVSLALLDGKGHLELKNIPTNFFIKN